MTFRGEARPATEDEKPSLWRLMVGIFPQYEAYQTKTKRDIPVVVVKAIEEAASGGATWRRTILIVALRPVTYLGIVCQTKVNDIVRAFTGWEMRPHQRELYDREARKE